MSIANVIYWAGILADRSPKVLEAVIKICQTAKLFLPDELDKYADEIAKACQAVLDFGKEYLPHLKEALETLKQLSGGVASVPEPKS